MTAENEQSWAAETRPCSVGRSWSWPLATLVAVTLLAQLAALVLRSRHQWQHFNLGWDFAIYHEALHQIGPHHLNPRIALLGYPFWRSHLELLMWPLALIGRIHRDDGLTLLYVQDTAMVGAEVVVVAWVWSATWRRVTGCWRAVPVVVVLVLLIGNPWLYQAAMEDFHFEVLGMFFVLLGGWELWSGRRRGWVWVAVTLMCGDVAATYVAGLGFSFLVASCRTRRTGAVLLASGIGWVVLAGLLGANKGSAIGNYAYLASSPRAVKEGFGGTLAVAAGVVQHPSRPIHALTSRFGDLWRNLAPTGLLGLVAPWSWGVLAVVLVTNGLNGNAGFVRSSFQNLPVYLFGVLGTVLLFPTLAARPETWRRAALLLWVATTLTAVVYDLQHLPASPAYRVSKRAAHELSDVRRHVPANAQVVSTFGVVGRFAGRRWVQMLPSPGVAVPVQGSDIVFVVAPTAGNQPLPPPIIDATDHYLRENLHAQVIHRGPEVTAFLWHPTGQKQIQLP